jgi:hypothetical protein
MLRELCSIKHPGIQTDGDATSAPIEMATLLSSARNRGLDLSLALVLQPKSDRCHFYSQLTVGSCPDAGLERLMCCYNKIPETGT